MRSNRKVAPISSSATSCTDRAKNSFVNPISAGIRRAHRQSRHALLIGIASDASDRAREELALDHVFAALASWRSSAGIASASKPQPAMHARPPETIEKRRL